MNDSFGSSFRPKLRDTRGLKRAGQNKISSSVRRPSNRDSRLRSKSPKKSQDKEPVKAEKDPESVVNQRDLREKMEKEIGAENDNLVISFCQNEDQGSNVKWELRETKTGDRSKRNLLKSETEKPIPEEAEGVAEPEKEAPKQDPKSVTFGKDQKSKIVNFLKKNKRKKKAKYLLKDHVERVLLILAQKYILSYHDRIRREKEHEKQKKTIQKEIYERKLQNLKNHFDESEQKIQSLWESRLAQNKVTKFTTRVDFKFIDLKLKKIQKIFDEKEFSLEVVDKARQGKNNLQEKVEANSEFFREFQERFKKARLKVIDANK